MFNFCDKIDFIFEKIGVLEEIMNNHKITIALKDEKILKPAILMHLMQIGESLNSLDKKAKKIVEEYNLIQEVKGAYNVRNFIAYDYEEVNLAIIESVLRNNLLILEEKINRIKNEKCK